MTTPGLLDISHHQATPGGGDLFISSTTANAGLTGSLAHLAIFPPLSDAQLKTVMDAAAAEGWITS